MRPDTICDFDNCYEKFNNNYRYLSHLELEHGVPFPEDYGLDDQIRPAFANFEYAVSICRKKQK